MTTGEARIVGGRVGRDPVRQVVLAILALYLTPALLLVLLIGCLGMACCGLLRLAGGISRTLEGLGRRDGPARAIGAPHIREAARSRSANY